MTAIITAADMISAITAKSNVLRSYTIQFRVVPTVDNEGTRCRFCQHYMVDTTIYFTDMARDTHSEDTCRFCVISLIDEHFDVDPVYTVTVEVVQ